MYPGDFEEIIWAAGEYLMLDYIKDCAEKQMPLEQKMHAKAMRLCREYLLDVRMRKSIIYYFEGRRNYYDSNIEKRNILD